MSFIDVLRDAAPADPAFEAVRVLAPARPGSNESTFKDVLDDVATALKSSLVVPEGFTVALGDTRRPGWFRLGLALTTNHLEAATALAGHAAALVRTAARVLSSPAWSVLVAPDRLRLSGGHYVVKGSELGAYREILEEPDAKDLQAALVRSLVDFTYEHVTAHQDLLGQSYPGLAVRALSAAGSRVEGAAREALLDLVAMHRSGVQVDWSSDDLSNKDLLVMLEAADPRERTLAACVARTRHDASLYRDLLLAREEATAWALDRSYRHEGSLDVLAELLTWAPADHPAVTRVLPGVSLEEWCDKERANAVVTALGERVDLAAAEVLRCLAFVSRFGSVGSAVIGDLDPRVLDLVVSGTSTDSYDETQDKAIATVIIHTEFVPTRTVAHSYGGYATEALRGHLGRDRARSAQWLRHVDIPVLEFLAHEAGSSNDLLADLLAEALERASTPEAQKSLQAAWVKPQRLRGVTLLQHADELRRLEARWTPLLQETLF